MMETVRDLEDFGSRLYYVESCLEAGTYIFDRFSSLGLNVQYQEFTVEGFTVRNVVAWLNGSDPSAPQFLFGAHYDSANELATDFEAGRTLSAPGADDDASGVAAVIELATILSDRTPKSTTKFVAFAAEESGLNGSFRFVEGEVKASVRYEGTAILDMIGYRLGPNDSALVFTKELGNELADATVSAVEEFDLDISVEVVVDPSITYSDHFPFWLADYPSMLVIEEMTSEGVSNPYYHTSNDTSDKLSQSQIAGTTAAVLGAFLLLEREPQADNTVIVVAAVGAVAGTTASVTAYYWIKRK
jgi:leucyl aminopeptidase